MLPTNPPSSEHAAQLTYLKDYEPPAFLVPTVELFFEIGIKETFVQNTMQIVRNKDGAKGSQAAPPSTLRLDGEKLELLEVQKNGKTLTNNEYTVTDQFLEIPGCTEDSFVVSIKNKIYPSQNLALQGLYLSGSILCTQNEPQGMRYISYIVDRPDVMSVYTTEIKGDLNQFPVMLSNGNLVLSKKESSHIQINRWHDPHPKPGYLFALVAGNLEVLTGQFQTQSGQEVLLEIYADPGKTSQCQFAMESLKNAMRWDEERFGLEYDLGRYMIVAVDSFNSGAMENKGLNIFNSSYVFANPETATDDDFINIEAVIGHEYFHNWTGNRVTLRDWFQLTLKEGLTVFRDREFTSDRHSRAVKRLQDIMIIQDKQFAEDQGPNAHPIRPSAFSEINNFYTLTVYEKGAEVIGMVSTIVGKEGFRKGIQTYFEMFDGQAITVEDFLHAMEKANPSFNGKAFLGWYQTAGTPQVKGELQYDSAKKEATLQLSQESASPTPLLIPLDYALYVKDRQVDQGLFLLDKSQSTMTFKGIEDRPTLAANRGFSAPIEWEDNQPEDTFYELVQVETDPYVRYRSFQHLMSKGIEDILDQKTSPSVETFQTLFKDLLKESSQDPAFFALLLSPPTLDTLVARRLPAQVAATHSAKTSFLQTLSRAHTAELAAIYELQEEAQYSLDTSAVGLRALKNVVGHYLSFNNENGPLIWQRYEQAQNMTDTIHSFRTLVHGALEGWEGWEGWEDAVAGFRQKWESNNLVFIKWMQVLTAIPDDRAYDFCQKLAQDPKIDLKVPNHLRAIYRNFSRNTSQFHHPSGRGYGLLADAVLTVDQYNPQIAADLAKSFYFVPKLEETLKNKAATYLDQILKKPKLSKNTFEIISKTVAQIQA